ncbi:hypothetical protein [Streptomyces phaeochromogenes]
MPDSDVTLSQIARTAGVGRAAVVNWRRRHGGLDATGGTDESPTFPRAAAEQWLRDLGKLYEPEPPRPPATLTFGNGATLTAYAPDLCIPAREGSGGEGYEEFGGYIDAEGRDGIPWPRANVRVETEGQPPYEVTDADVDISYAGGSAQYLKLVWRAEKGRSEGSAL